MALNNLRIAITSFFLISVAFSNAFAATVSDFKALAEKLDATEWDIVSREVKERLPGLIVSRGYLDQDEYDLLKKYINNSQNAVAMWQALNEGDYQGIAGTIANKTANDLRAKIRNRFGADSKIVFVLKLVEDNDKLTKKLIKAALDTDQVAARAAIREALEEYGQSKYNALIAKGEKFWKTLIGEVIPGNRLATRFGISPIDLYIQGVKDWADLVRRFGVEINNEVLDCTYLRYRIMKRTLGAADAADQVSLIALGGNFDCKAAARAPENENISVSFSRNFFATLIPIRGTAATFGKYRLEAADIKALLLEYDSRGSKFTPFSEWLVSQLSDALARRKNTIIDPLSREQSEQARQQIALAHRVIEELRSAILRNKGIDPKKEDEERKRETAARAVEIACNAARRIIGQADGAYKNGDFPAARSALLNAELTLDQVRKFKPCPQVRSRIGGLRRTISQTEALIGRVRNIRQACQLAGLNSVIAELLADPKRHRLLDLELPKLERAKEAASLLERSRRLYRGNRLDEAEKILNRAIRASQETGPGDCTDLTRRARDGLEKITALRKEAARLAGVLSRCDREEIDRLIVRYQRPSHPFFKAAVKQLQNKRKECKSVVAEDNDAEKQCQRVVSAFESGLTAYKANRLALARRHLGSAQATLEKARSVPRCTELEERIRKGQDKIATLEAQLARVNRAISSCDGAELQKILAVYQGRKHLFFRRSIARINTALPKCRKNDRTVAAREFCKAARTRLNGARADFRANRLNRAERRLRSLDRDLTPAKSKLCPELKTRTGKGLANIAVLRAENQRLRQAVSACDIDKLQALKTRYNGKKHPWYGKASGRATAGMKACRSGAGSLAERQAYCLRKGGKGYYPGNVDAGGKYYCLPTQRTANRWCNKNNPGSGWHAGKVSRVGAFTCTQNRDLRTAEARANCRRQISAQGKVYAYTRMNRNGTYNCFSCDAGQYWSNGQCRSRTVKTCPGGYVLRGTLCYPRGGGQQGGGGGARYKCTIFNPDGSLLGGPGSTSTIYTARPIPSAKCVRVR